MHSIPLTDNVLVAILDEDGASSDTNEPAPGRGPEPD
jgi:hypothetical protein